MLGEFVVVHVVPTGVKASIGGYVGDATPATNMIASIADVVISHPNVVNGVLINEAKDNVMYVEGYALDMFFRGHIGLNPVESNKVAVVLDSGMDEESYNLALNTINAMRTVSGVNVIGVYKTSKNVSARAVKTKNGSFVGELENESVLLSACRKAVKDGAEALAISLSIHVDIKDLRRYFSGKGANPYGGTEAIISHLVTEKFMLPAAHAPLLSRYEIYKETHSGVVDPRAAAEAVGPAYLGCVLKGLSRAPRLVRSRRCGNCVTVDDVDALVLPYSCMGGVPALAAAKLDIPIIAVKENKTVMKVTPRKVGLNNVIVAENYWEVGGILSAMKEGLDPYELRRPVSSLKLHI